jgi:transposase
MLTVWQEPTMFLRPYKRLKDGKEHTYYALVESERTPDGPRQRTVAYLGELNHNQERRWQRAVVFYNRQGDAQQLRLFSDAEDVALPDDPDIVRIRLKQVGWTNGRRFGDVWLAWQLWRLLHLDEIVQRHVPANKHTCRPADIVAIEVINRLCGPCSEFALAEHWYASTGLEDLLGVADGEVTKDRLYRTLDGLRAAQPAIEDDLQKQLQTLFDLDYDLLLYDLTSTYFEGLAEANELAARGYSRDHRRDCKQVVLALVVTREGFPLAHFTLKGNTQDLATVERVVTEVEKRFGRVQRVWVMDRGMISAKTLRFLKRSGRQYLLALRRSALTKFARQLRTRSGWQRLAEHEEVEVKLIRQRRQHYLLARSKPRRQKERAIRRQQRRGLVDGLRKLQARVAKGALKNRDKILECVGRLQERYPKARTFVSIAVAKKGKRAVTWTWDVQRYRAALVADGAYVLQSNRGGWTFQEFWETYMQLAVAEKAFRVLKSELLLRPVWHQYSGRVQAHVFVCVLAYALWKTLDHMAKQAGLLTLIHKPADRRYGQAIPKPRPMTPEVILRELARIKIGDIILETTDGRQLLLRRVARPDAEQKRILAALKLELPERLSQDRLL